MFSRLLECLFSLIATLISHKLILFSLFSTKLILLSLTKQPCYLSFLETEASFLSETSNSVPVKPLWPLPHVAPACLHIISSFFPLIRLLLKIQGYHFSTVLLTLLPLQSSFGHIENVFMGSRDLGIKHLWVGRWPLYHTKIKSLSSISVSDDICVYFNQDAMGSHKYLAELLV